MCICTHVLVCARARICMHVYIHMCQVSVYYIVPYRHYTVDGHTTCMFLTIRLSWIVVYCIACDLMQYILLCCCSPPINVFAHYIPQAKVGV